MGSQQRLPFPPPKPAQTVGQGQVLQVDAGKYVSQLPFTQTSLLLQSLLQSPQLRGDVSRSTQPVRPLPNWQASNPCGHWLVISHLPVTQRWPWPHCTPHAPQLLGSLWISRHVPLQSKKSGRHSQLPALQYSVAPHCTPQAPQLRASAARSRHP